MGKHLMIAAMVAGFLSGATARAEDEAQQEAQAKENFKKADANGDGKVTLEEAVAANESIPRDLVRRIHGAADTNKDGGVVWEELKTFLNKLRTAMKDGQEKFNALDVNADGKVSLSEATANKDGDERAMAEAIFKKADNNSDGFVDRDELNGLIFDHVTEP